MSHVMIDPAEREALGGPQVPTGRGGEGWIRLDWPANLPSEPHYTYEHPQFQFGEIIESDGYRWGRIA